MTTTTSKPQFYTSDVSLWSSAPRLAIVELGYPEDAFEVKDIDILAGENFNPDFVELTNSAATIPALAVQGDVLNDTAKVIKYLIANAPNAPSSSDVPFSQVIEAVHEESLDPVELMVGSARNDAERKAKAGYIPGKYWAGRQASLEKYAAVAPTELKSFYEKKIAYNTFYNNIFHGSPDEATLKKYYGNAATLWKRVGDFLNGPFSKSLAERKGPFFGGEKPGEADFHTIAWLARTVTAAGGSIDKLEEAIETQLNASVKEYYQQWAMRSSFISLGIF